MGDGTASGAARALRSGTSLMCPELVGRADEVEALRTRLGAVVDGRGGVVGANPVAYRALSEALLARSAPHRRRMRRS